MAAIEEVTDCTEKMYSNVAPPPVLKSEEINLRTIQGGNIVSEKLQNRLLEKSKEAFVMAIEIYNKPTIRYRVEGFSFFICNAWELMLKAHIINKEGEQAIYFADNPDRTISLDKCLRKVFTNETTPARMNLMKIIELRNTSTHFITEEYEMVYIPLFQSCVLNYVEKMQSFHHIDMTEVIPQNFLTLAVSMKALDENAIRAKYPAAISQKLIETHNQLAPMIAENNSGFAIKIEHYLYLTKNRDEATDFVHIDKNAGQGAAIITKLKDPNNTHKYTMRTAIREINFRLGKAGVNFKIDQYVFNLFNKVYNIKENEEFCYVHRQYKNPTYSYSAQTIDLLINEISKDPENFKAHLKASAKKRKQKQSTPGA